MAKFRDIKNSFIAGVISETALGRDDLPQYKHSCKQLKNMIPLLSGGAYTRPGTIFEESFAAADFRAPFLIPFIGSDGTKYMINLLQKSTTGAAHDARFYATPVVGAPCSAAASVTNGNLMPYSVSQMPQVRWAQSGDVMWLVHPAHRPRVLKRTGASTFKLILFDAENLDGTAMNAAQGRDAWAYQRQNTTGVTLTPSGVAGAITVTASANLFEAGHVGSMWKIDHAGTIGSFLITGYISPTQVNATVGFGLGAAGAVTTWWEPAWSDARGWPCTASFFEQRLVFAGSDAFPDSVWHSNIAAFTVMSKANVLNPQADPALTESDAFTATLAEPIPAKIMWLRAGGTSMLIGTERQEWSLSRADTSTGYDVENYSASHQSDNGSNGVVAEVGNEIFFVSRDGLTVRALVFSNDEQSYVAEDVAVFYPEFPYPGRQSPTYFHWREIKRMVWDGTRNTLWCLDWAGNWRGLLRSRRLGVTAWHSHELGGYNSAVTPGSSAAGLDGTDATQWSCTGSVIDMAVLPNSATNQDDVWLVVRRKVNGTWHHYIERMVGSWVESDINEDAMLVFEALWTDCSRVEYNAAASPPPWTMTHLAGETVVATFSNPDHGIFDAPAAVVPLSGALTAAGVQATSLPDWGNVLFPYTMAVGYNYVSLVEPVTPNAGSIIGGALGGTQRPTKAIVRFRKTMAAKVGQTTAKLFPVTFTVPNQPTDTAPSPFSGVKEASLDSSYVRDGALIIQRDRPLPMALVCIVVEGMVYD